MSFFLRLAARLSKTPPPPPPEPVSHEITHVEATFSYKGMDGNQDGYFVDEARGLAIVCDGMGGRSDGSVASATAIEFIARQRFDKTQNESTLIDALKHAVIEASVTVRHRGFGLPNGMGTTLSFAWNQGTKWFLVNVGDTRIYRVSTTEIELLSMDDFIDVEVTPGQMRRALTQYVGGGTELNVHVRTLQLSPDNCLLICSDGIWEVVGDEVLRYTFAQHQTSLLRAVASLIEAARANGGSDDMTVVILTPAFGEPVLVEAAPATDPVPPAAADEARPHPGDAPPG